MAATPIRNMRVSDERWEAWARAAAEAGVSITELVVQTMDNAGLSRASGRTELVPQAWPVGGGTSFVSPSSVEAARAPAKKGRSRTCPHRIPETSFCRWCDS